MINKNQKLFIVSFVTILFFAFPTAHAADVVRPITFPVEGPSSFRNDFGEPRDGGARTHEGVDIIADKMTPIVSVVDGRVVYVVSPEASWGYSISIQDEDGYTYRYLHMNNDNPGTDDGNGGEEHAYAPGIRRGARVKQGQLVGWVGDSGNAEATISHLHFEIHKGRTLLSPYPSLVQAAAESLFSSSIRVGNAPTVSHSSDGSPVDYDLEYFFADNLSVGSSGEAVRELQLRLAAMGYFTSTATGYFGTITKAAVMKYQDEKLIRPVDGIVGEITRNALNGGATIPPPTTPHPLTQILSVGSNGEEVRQLQLLLTQLGYLKNTTATGYFGPLTKTAVISFQRAKGLTPTGVVDKLTRAFLNGCTSNEGYSSVTGESCAGTIVLPAGCSSLVGYSQTSGQACGSSLPPGCSSNTGYSTITGKACWLPQ